MHNIWGYIDFLEETYLQVGGVSYHLRFPNGHNVQIYRNHNTAGYDLAEWEIIIEMRGEMTPEILKCQIPNNIPKILSAVNTTADQEALLKLLKEF